MKPSWANPRVFIGRAPKKFGIAGSLSSVTSEGSVEVTSITTTDVVIQFFNDTQNGSFIGYFD